MEFKKDRSYSKSHEWVRELVADEVEIGISDFAQDALGDIVFVNLPEAGDEVEIGTPFCDVESVKAVSDIYSPVDGIVSEVNEELLDNPAQINEQPFESWLIRVKKIAKREELLSAEEYEALVKEEA
ncbi:glycine cleavage system protein GcvH [Sinanaerobacter sp. ZZT-01]|uniref:glycine cleavage system protein GcvH n=1 Tax=Sinanaerobacter sp. ZZT-01 TaxID=3111540 RepID=UPI002D77941C|nr:glycine cleavage system protein GcvH [Sinanaerobacter sp. ZZT-01]WRR94415.1 glycine cleavage system protein GcvH [Sinanaerobacter sp. ZZT-01]